MNKANKTNVHIGQNAAPWLEDFIASALPEEKPWELDEEQALEMKPGITPKDLPF